MFKTCPICGKEFKTKYRKQVFCSHSCVGVSQRKRKILTCDYCGEKFCKVYSQIKRYEKHFCSNKCRYLANKKKDKIYYENNYAYILLIKDNITKKVLFDIDDIDKLNKFKWHLHLRKKDMRYDACTNSYSSHSKKSYINMARYIMNCPSDKVIDHINRNPLDNRKSNLRICTIYENNQNKGNNSSGCVGVVWDKSRNKWYVHHKGKYIGRFYNLEDAIKAKQIEINKP